MKFALDTYELNTFIQTPNIASILHKICTNVLADEVMLEKRGSATETFEIRNQHVKIWITFILLKLFFLLP